jgi:ribosomal protein S18 acetylase RimI-like enzyme
MSLREIAVADRPQIAELIALYDHELWRRPYPSGEWKDEYLEGWLGYVAEAGGRLTGLALGSIDPHGTGAVHLVFVREEARRHGLAKALLAALVARFREAGASWVTLNVDTTNEVGLAVWRRLGFVEDAVHLNTPLDRLVERLVPRDAEPSFASIHIQSDDERSIERAVQMLDARYGGRAGTVLLPPRSGWTVLYDERCDEDRMAQKQLADEISDRLGAVVVAMAVEAGEVVRLALYERGRLVDEYLSVPEYYGPLPRVDALSLAANPTVISRLTGADAAAVRAVLRTAESAVELPPAAQHAEEIGGVLGLAGAALGYARGRELPGAVPLERG